RWWDVRVRSADELQRVLFTLLLHYFVVFFFFSSRRRHTRLVSDWSSDVCSSDLIEARCSKTLHGYRYGNDHLASIVDPHHASVCAVKRLCDFLIALPVLGTQFVIQRKVAAAEPAAQGYKCSLHQPQLFRVRRRKVEAQYVAATIEISAVENQDAVAVVDPGAGLGRRDEPSQYRRNALRIDREFDARKRFVGRPIALTGLQFQKPFRVNRDRVGFDRSRSRDCTGNNFALSEQALHSRVDQSRTELRQVEHASDQCDETGEIEKNNASGEARKTLRYEEVPC